MVAFPFTCASLVFILLPFLFPSAAFSSSRSRLFFQSRLLIRVFGSSILSPPLPSLHGLKKFRLQVFSPVEASGGGWSPFLPADGPHLSLPPLPGGAKLSLPRSTPRQSSSYLRAIFFPNPLPPGAHLFFFFFFEFRLMVGMAFSPLSGLVLRRLFFFFLPPAVWFRVLLFPLRWVIALPRLIFLRAADLYVVSFFFSDASPAFRRGGVVASFGVIAV